MPVKTKEVNEVEPLGSMYLLPSIWASYALAPVVGSHEIWNDSGQAQSTVIFSGTFITENVASETSLKLAWLARTRYCPESAEGMVQS